MEQTNNPVLYMSPRLAILIEREFKNPVTMANHKWLIIRMTEISEYMIAIH